MNSKVFSYLLLFLCSVVFVATNIFAEGKDEKKSQVLNKTAGQPIRTLLNINNISTVFKNDGISDIDRAETNSGLVYPKGSGKAAVYTSGMLWGAKITGDPQVRVGGTAYRTGLQGGKVTNNNLPWDQLTAEDPDAGNVRMYRVRPDVIPSSGPRPTGYATPDVSSEVADNEGSESSIIAQYELDWTQWPAADGAPFDDVDGNGTYDPAVDIPGVPGADQTIWFVANDLNQGRTNNLYGADPLGIEMQATIWGYAQTGALGSMFFRKYKIINKSNEIFNDMYLSMWSDVDLGNSNDDFAGCDTTLSLGFCYNANAVDATYNPLPPPAVGFDFFQGPILDGVAGQDRDKNGVDDAEDFGIFDGKVVGPGKINLPMTSFYYFARGDASVTDPTQGDPQGSNQFYNFFQGRIGLSGDLFVDPNTGQTTTYALSGDVQTRQGWLDGQLIGGGDRRIGSASGPFQMAPGDTQEVVVAEIVAGALPGVDRISAIGLLKFYDQSAQVAYDNFFDLPVAPPAPIVTVAELDEEIILDWSTNRNRVNATETSDNKGYKFQGYNVYQLPSASSPVSEGIRIATYDVSDGIGKINDRVFDTKTGSVVVLPVQFGNDTGLKRYISITQDAINQRPLINGIRYYFAVTAYSFNTDIQAVPNNLENPISILTVIPHSPNPGERYTNVVGDTLDVVHDGVSDGAVAPIVVDPTRTTGQTYRVTFQEAEEGITWNLTNTTTNQVILSNRSNQTGDDDYVTVDGILAKVIGAPPQIKGTGEADGMVEIAYGGTLLTPDQYDAAGTPYNGNKVWHSGNSADGDRYYVSAGNDGNVSSLYRYVDFASPRDFEFRFTETGGYGVYAFEDDKICTVPFELWDIGVATPDDPSDDLRMIPLINNNGSSLDAWGYATGTDPAFGFMMSDWVYWMDPKDKTPGDVGYKQFENSCIQSGGAGAIYDYSFDTDPDAGDYNTDLHGGFVYPIGRFVICDLDEDGNMPPAGTTIRINYTKPNQVTDSFTFTAPVVNTSTANAKEDVEKINVFPNPYYGVNSEELNKYNRFVTFSHLPTKATIRIFNLAGVLVKTIEKDDAATQFQRWDLSNETGLPVASGLYIAYIEMPEIGETKILKVAIIQEQQILDRF
jgi:hypothetical protein